MIDMPQPSPDYQWAINAEPDFLVLQFPPLPVFADGRSHDAMKALFTQRGFQPISETDDLDLRPANGCSLTRVDPSRAELLVTIGDQVGASRIPLPDIDSGWLGRVVETGQAAVLLVNAAVREDGTTTKEHLRRDIDAGGVLAAIVPSADLG